MAITTRELGGYVLHCILSNDSRVCKSDEELKSAFKVFTLHAGHFDSSSFFPLKKHAATQFKQNLYSNINTFIGFLHFCVINIIQFHFRWNIIRFYLKRKEIKKTLNPIKMCDIFWYVFLSSLYFKNSFANNPFLEYLDSLANCTFFSMSSPVVEWWSSYSTLAFSGSIHDRIILAAGFFRVYLWTVTRHVY